MRCRPGSNNPESDLTEAGFGAIEPIPAKWEPRGMPSGEAVPSPSWSIHCGAGAGGYGFIFGRGGENQEFADMDAGAIAHLTRTRPC